MTCEFEMSRREEGVYHLSGELVFETVPDVLERSVMMFQSGVDVDIDLSGVVRADSAGLALLIEWVRRANKQRHKMVFRNMPEQMSAIVGLVGLDEVLPLE